MPDKKTSSTPSPATPAAADLRLVQKRLAELRPVLANAVVGDFSKDLKIPTKEDEFTELFVGVQTMQEVIREQLQELQELNQSLEAKAQERSRALEEAQALTHLGSWEWDVASGIIAWSDELYRIYGLKPQERPIGFEEFMGMIHPDDRDRVNKVINESYQSAKEFEFEHRIILPNKQQRTLHGIGKVITDKSGQPVRMIGTSQDITERKKAEAALHQSDERFRAVTNATHDLVYDLDLHKQTMWFNEALQSEYGYPNQGDRSFDWWKARIHPGDAVRIDKQITALLKSDQQTWHAEYRFRKADGSYAVVRNRAFMLRSTDGVPERIIGSCLDITQQKQLDRAKDEFISLVSHQLRTPLTIIRLYGNMLTDGIAGPLGELQQNYVQKITDGSVRLIKLVGDILNISRLELNRIKVDTSPTNVDTLIESCMDEMASIAKAKHTKMTYHRQAGLGLAPIDSTIFGEILRNLVSNAIRYANPKGGKVEISFKKLQAGYVLCVKDDGIGIPLSAQGHIFERFYRANNASKVDGEGTGLGLYLVKLFAEAAGGEVWLKSTEGKGTSFYVRFPLEGVQPAVRD
jgi:PAS domain S-box-containing protein